MSNHYEDWADWAGDHTQQAEEDLRKERGQSDAWWGGGVIVEEPCEHDNPDNDYECVDCGARIEGWEPNDNQIFAHYGQTKEVA